MFSTATIVKELFQSGGQAKSYIRVTDFFKKKTENFNIERKTLISPPFLPIFF